MKNILNDYGYRTRWHHAYVHTREGYFSSVVDFHEHEYYEVILVLSGNIKILLSDQTETGTGNRIILTRPGTPHFITCNPDTLYSRRYLLFSHDFLADYVPEWNQLQTIFGKTGRSISITPEQTEQFARLLDQINNETDLFRQRLLVLYLLSRVADFAKTKNLTAVKIPPYVTDALNYIGDHFAEKIIAADLAWQLNVSRTTLMTGFKQYTGSTINEYLTAVRGLQSVYAAQLPVKTGYQTFTGRLNRSRGSGKVWILRQFGADPQFQTVAWNAAETVSNQNEKRHGVNVNHLLRAISHSLFIIRYPSINLTEVRQSSPQHCAQRFLLIHRYLYTDQKEIRKQCT